MAAGEAAQVDRGRFKHRGKAGQQVVRRDDQAAVAGFCRRQEIDAEVTRDKNAAADLFERLLQRLEHRRPFLANGLSHTRTDGVFGQHDLHNDPME